MVHEEIKSQKVVVIVPTGGQEDLCTDSEKYCLDSGPNEEWREGD